MNGVDEDEKTSARQEPAKNGTDSAGWEEEVTFLPPVVVADEPSDPGADPAEDAPTRELYLPEVTALRGPAGADAGDLPEVPTQVRPMPLPDPPTMPVMLPELDVVGFPAGAPEPITARREAHAEDAERTGEIELSSSQIVELSRSGLHEVAAAATREPPPAPIGGPGADEPPSGEVTGQFDLSDAAGLLTLDDVPEVTGEIMLSEASGPIGLPEVTGPVELPEMPTQVRRRPTRPPAARRGTMAPPALPEMTDEIELGDEGLEELEEDLGGEVTRSVVLDFPQRGALERMQQAAAARQATLEATIASELAAEGRAERRAVLEIALARMLEARGDEDAAIAAYSRAFEADRLLGPPRVALRRLLARRGLWEELLAALDAEAEADTQAEAPALRRAATHLERAEILELRLGDGDSARKALERAVEVDPDCVRGHLQLLRRYAATGDRVGEIRTLGELARLAREPARKAALYLELARVAAGERDTAAMEGALDLALGTGAERNRTLLARQWRAASEAPEAHRLALERRVGFLDEVGDADDAIAVRRRLSAVMLEQDPPDRPAARRAIEEALAAAMLRGDDVLVVLDAVALATDDGRHDDAAALLARAARLVPAGTAAEVGLRLRQVVSLSRAGRADDAFSSLLSLLRERGKATPEVRSIALRTTLERADLVALEELASGELERAAGDSRWRAGVLAALATLAELRGDRARAEERLREALLTERAVEPEVDRGTLDALERLLVQQPVPAEQRTPGEGAAVATTARAADVAALFEAALEGHGRRPRESLLESLALWRRAAGDREGAADALAMLCAEHPGDVARKRRLALALSIAGQHATAGELFADLAGEMQASPTECAEHAVQAALCAERVGDRATALLRYRAAAEARPDDRFVAESIERILRDERRALDLARHLEGEAERSPDDARAVARWIEAAELHLRRADGAAEAERLARRADAATTGGSREALRLRMRACLVAGDVAGALDAAVEDATERQSGPARAYALVEAGRLAEERQRDDARAAELYRKAAAEDVPEAAWMALRGLLRVAARQGGSGALAESYGRLAALSEDAATRRALEAEARAQGGGAAGQATGDVERLVVAAEAGDRAGFAAAARALAREGGTPEGVAAALALAAEDAGEPGQLPFAFERSPTQAAVPLVDRTLVLDPAALALRAGIASPPVAAQLHYLRGLVLERQGKLAAALEAAALALDASPQDLAALDLVRTIALRAGDRAGYAGATARLAATLGKHQGQRAGQLFKEAAEIVERELGKPGEAAPLWRHALERAPDDHVTFSHLRGLLEKADEGRGDPRALAELLTFRIVHVPPGARPPLYAERSELRERFGDLAGAAVDLEAILARVPDHLESLRRLAELRGRLADERGGDVGAAIEPLDRYVGLVRDPSVLAPALQKLAALHEQRGETPRAVQRLRELLDLPEVTTVLGDTAPLSEKMVQLCVEMRDYTRAAEEARRAAGTDPEGRARGEVRAGRIYRDHAKNKVAGEAAFRRALEVDPLCVEAAEELGRASASLGKSLEAAVAELRRAPASARAWQAVAALGALAGEARWGRVAGIVAAALAGRPSAGLGVRTLGEAELARLRPPAWAALAPVFAAFTPGLVRLDEAEGLGTGRAALVDEEVLAKSLGRALAASTFSVVVVEGDRLDAVTDRLVLGTRLGRNPPPKDRFLLAHAVARVRERAARLVGGSPDRLEVLLGAMARAVGARRAGVPEAEADKLAKAIVKGLDRKQRKDLSVYAELLCEASPAAAAEGARRTVERAALLATGDLGAALDALGGGGSPVAAALLGFLASDEGLALVAEGARG